jgi:hypothetical protein
MEFKGTVERLVNLLEARRDAQHLYSARKAMDRLIEAQIERVQVRVLFHTLDGLEFFSQPGKPYQYEVLSKNFAEFVVMRNSEDGRYWVPVSGPFDTLFQAQELADKLNREAQ